VHRTVLAAAVTLVWAQTALALVMERVPLRRLAGESDLVVAAVVESSTSRYDDGVPGRRIVTDFTVRVTTVIRGDDPGRSVVVTVPGGIVGRDGQAVFGAPAFAPGEEVVLFLGATRATSSGPRRDIVALTQGVFRVERAPGIPPRASQRLAGVAIRGETPAPDELSFDLADLVAKVRSLPRPAGAP
jgi:hypothetical protein